MSDREEACAEDPDRRWHGSRCDGSIATRLVDAESQHVVSVTLFATRHSSAFWCGYDVGAPTAIHLTITGIA